MSNWFLSALVFLLGSLFGGSMGYDIGVVSGMQKAKEQQQVIREQMATMRYCEYAEMIIEQNQCRIDGDVDKWLMKNE